MNLIMAGIFLGLENWAFSMGFEETTVSLALIYGILTTIANAFFVMMFFKNK